MLLALKQRKREKERLKETKRNRERRKERQEERHIDGGRRNQSFNPVSSSRNNDSGSWEALAI